MWRTKQSRKGRNGGAGVVLPERFEVAVFGRARQALQVVLVPHRLRSHSLPAVERRGLSCTHVLTVRQQLLHMCQPAVGRRDRYDQSAHDDVLHRVSLGDATMQYSVHMYLGHVILIKHRDWRLLKISVLS